MADRHALIVDSSSQQIKEIPTSDVLLADAFTASGAVTGGSLTDGTATVSSGALTGVTTVTASGALTGGSLTDGTATISSGALSGATSVAASTVTASTSANITQVALTSSSNAVAWDASAAANAYHLLTENTTFAAPSNAVEGAIISVEIAQGGTPYTVAWNTIYEFAASTAPTMTATANKTDILSFRYNGSIWQEIGRVQNLAQT
jgi:hypothetical protein